MSVVMITGGSGFVGSHLVERLLQEGHEVHVLDRAPLDACDNLRDVRDNPRLHYTEGDLRDTDLIERWYRKDATHLYHFAAIVGVHLYMEDPLSLIDINVIATRRLVGLALEHGQRILFTSTSEVYGRNPKIGWRESDDRVLGPTDVDRWSYSTSKACVEHMLHGAAKVQGLKMSIVRFFNVYGPRQNPWYVVSKSVYRALRDEQPQVYDGGAQTRCFTFVEDVVEGVLRASRVEGALGQVFNLGNPVETSMKEVVDQVIRISGSTAGIEAVDTGKVYGKVYEDIPRRVPNVDKAAELLDWRPTTSLEEGLTRTISWARENPWYLADGR